MSRGGGSGRYSTQADVITARLPIACTGANGNSVRQPSLLVTGINVLSTRRPRNPRLRAHPGGDHDFPARSADPGRIRPGAPFGLGKPPFTTYCATTTSNDASANSSASASPTAIASMLWSFSRFTRSFAFLQHRFGNIDARQSAGSSIFGKARMPVPTPTSRIRPPICSAACTAAERPCRNTGPNTMS